MGVPIEVEPEQLDEMSGQMARVRLHLLGARESLVGLGGRTVEVQMVDQGTDTLVNRCQRGLIEVAADLQYVALALTNAAEEWRRTDGAVAGACR
jgi:hypothetical protein